MDFKAASANMEMCKIVQSNAIVADENQHKLRKKCRCLKIL